jgi:hypothetical protein
MKPVDGDILEACESVSKGRAHRMPKKICWWQYENDGTTLRNEVTQTQRHVEGFCEYVS